MGATLVPTPIDTTHLAGKSIVQVAAGEQHSLLLADDGTVFAFGNNVFGLTGLNRTDGITPIATPIDSTNLVGDKIVAIDAGRLHSLLLSDDGSVFSFGCNPTGEVGQSSQGSFALASEPVPLATEIDFTNLFGGQARVVSIAGGSFFSLLIVVPEPGSATLIVIAGVCAVLCRRG